MRYRIATMAAALCVLAGFARGDDLLKSDYPALHGLEQEFDNIAADVSENMQGITNPEGAEHACLNGVFFGAFHMGELFGHYKYSEAITVMLVDEHDREYAKKVLKEQTNLALAEIAFERKRINGALGTCSKFSLAVAKGTELLAAMKRADGAIRSILGRISPAQQ